MSYYNTYNNIPVFVILRDDDDVDSVVSFATGTSSSVTADDLIMTDSESRWAREPVSSTTAPLRQHQNKNCPHHPERSVSYSSSSDAAMANAMTTAPLRNNNTSNYSNSPTSRLVTLRQKHAGLGRTTRLTRMAERAKAVARTPISRRGSRNQRHSLPAIPIRHRSSSTGIDTSSRRSSAPISSTSYSIGCVSFESSKSGRSSSLSGRPSYKQRRNSSMIPRRRNSSMKPQRRNSIHCITGTYQEDGTILLTASSSLTGSSIASKQLQVANPTGGGRRATGCFQIACSAEFGESGSRPPRLPQRYPTETQITTSAA